MAVNDCCYKNAFGFEVVYDTVLMDEAFPVARVVYLRDDTSQFWIFGNGLGGSYIREATALA